MVAWRVWDVGVGAVCYLSTVEARNGNRQLANQKSNFFDQRAANGVSITNSAYTSQALRTLWRCRSGDRVRGRHHACTVKIAGLMETLWMGSKSYVGENSDAHQNKPHLSREVPLGPASGLRVTRTLSGSFIFERSVNS